MAKSYIIYIVVQWRLVFRGTTAVAGATDKYSRNAVSIIVASWRLHPQYNVDVEFDYDHAILALGSGFDFNTEVSLLFCKMIYNTLLYNYKLIWNVTYFCFIGGQNSIRLR